MADDQKKASGGDGKGGPKTPTARKQEQRRKEKLALVQQQIDEGSLTIRQMTPEERKKYPPRPRKPRKKR
jgi:hypothetical protein